MILRRVLLALGVLLVAAVVLRVVAWLVTPLIPALLSLLISALVLWWLLSLLMPRRGDKG